MKKVLILFFTILPYCITAQDNNVEKVILEFSCFKYPDTEYRIDYKKKELTCIMKYQIHNNKDSVVINKSYTFADKEFEKFRVELEQNIPDSIVRKSESALDGGGFVISYVRRNKKNSKLIIINPYRKSEKYTQEFKKIDSFFEFAYSVVKDSSGIEALDQSYRPYFTGLPIRKVSENPLEYKAWGSISGNATSKNDLIPFLESLPKDKCVIINFDNQLSYAWQEDILRLYIVKNSNLRFANMKWLKYTRKNLIEFKEKIKTIGSNQDEMDKLKNTTSYRLYMNGSAELLDNWLKLPEESIATSVEDYRKNCR
ncbi:hypothetical protein [Flavobacterium nitrogenifigens]|uniref:hypothetical protein n=1 Tax=Flavobacterium nitrogenifigens TaxID=1617283 RepID=UPI0031AB6A29